MNFENIGNISNGTTPIPSTSFSDIYRTRNLASDLRISLIYSFY